MKLKEFLENIQEMIKEDPSLLELDVITSKDAEGNGYEEVYWSPSPGVYDSDENEFVPSNSEDFEEEHEYTKEDINAICIN